MLPAGTAKRGARESQEGYGPVVSATNGIGFAASNNPNENTSVRETIAMYCLPSTL
jgi:hypothetical protein